MTQEEKSRLAQIVKGEQEDIKQSWYAARLDGRSYLPNRVADYFGARLEAVNDFRDELARIFPELSHDLPPAANHLHMSHEIEERIQREHAQVQVFAMGIGT